MTGKDIQKISWTLCCAVGVLICGVVSQDLHSIKPKQNQCFDIYQEKPSIYIRDLSKTCVENLPMYKSCVGLTTKNKEVIIVKCRTKMGKFKQLDEGCYRLINKDMSEGVVCQKFQKKRGCEIIGTPSGLNIEVFCVPSKPEGIVVVKQTTEKTK